MTVSANSPTPTNSPEHWWGAKSFSPFDDTNTDARARDFFWTLALGPSAFTTPSLSRSPTPPQSPQRIPESIPRMPLDPKLQGHFFRMQQVALRTCHPGRIRAEALVLASGCHPAPALAKALFFAGIADLTYMRSVAVLVHGVLVELAWRGGDGWAARIALEEELLALALAAFENSWMSDDTEDALGTPTGLGEPTSLGALVPTLTQMLNIAAFLGDLAGLSLVPDSTVPILVNMLLAREKRLGPTRCRALHVFLLRGGALALGMTGMRKLRARIVRRGREAEGMVRRWLIEITNVLDRASEAHATFELKGPGVKWDRTLDRNVALLALGGADVEVEERLMEAIMV